MHHKAPVNMMTGILMGDLCKIGRRIRDTRSQ
ncbi:hypothetical protein B0G77_3564 [Paraburkholderia sp. BL10I2N1]|nr:hypothetical protein B0G77_3564 [Paraburkholderia sp. BL10I2N1]